MFTFSLMGVIRSYLLFCCFGLFTAHSQTPVLKQDKITSCQDWSTYFGGLQQEEVKGIAKDNNGNIYLTGTANSNNLFVTSGQVSDTLNGDYDAFAAKFDSCGNLLWSTFIGSTDFDSGEKIVCTTGGEVLICGSTFGTDFPVTPGAYQVANGGSYDAFVIRLSASGNLLWSTYFGKAGADFSYDIALDAHENIYFGGSSNSSNLPTTPQSVQQNPGGALDAYLVSFTPTGNFRWCTYFGGSASEDVHVLRSDKDGNIYLAGGTFSQNIVMSANAFQQFNNGGMDVYVLKTDSSGNALWSTYLGESGLDDCYALGTDQAGNVYLSGLTYSALFPVTTGCFQDSLNQYSDLFLSKFSSAGSLVWSTFIGGSDLDDCKSLAVNGNQEITLLARTQSADMPLAGLPLQSSPAGNYDLYLARFDSAGNFFWGSYLGGSNEETPCALVTSGNNYCYLSGSSLSVDYPVTPGSFQTIADSLQEGIVSKVFLPVNPSLAAASIKKENDLYYFPNPACDRLTIRMPHDDDTSGCLEIFNAAGFVVLKNNYAGASLTLDVSSLGEGIYYLRMNALVKKLVIQRQ